jgi:hypothetical protein
MKRYSPLLLTLILALFVVPTLSQAAPTPASTTAKKAPATSRLALREDVEDEEEFEFEDEAEEIEIEECEAGFEIFELEEEELDEAEEEELEEEIEECEEEVSKGKKNSTAVTAPEACRVRSAESSITTLPGTNRVQLTVRYLTYKPSTVSVDLRLKDRKGTLQVDSSKERLDKKGVLHLTTKVSDAVMERALKAKEFDVGLRATKTPSYCGNMLEQELQAKHPVGNARVYTQRVG